MMAFVSFFETFWAGRLHYLRPLFNEETLIADIGANAANSHFVRILPVRAPRSERRCFSNRSRVFCAANATEEPEVFDAA